MSVLAEHSGQWVSHGHEDEIEVMRGDAIFCEPENLTENVAVEMLRSTR